MATIVQNELNRVGDLIVGEVLDPIAYCEQTLTVLDGQKFVLGALGQNSGGKQIVCTTGANCNGIILEPATPSGADGAAVFMTKGPAVVNYAAINFGGLSTADKSAAVAALLVLNIEVRVGPTIVTL